MAIGPLSESIRMVGSNKGQRELHQWGQVFYVSSIRIVMSVSWEPSQSTNKIGNLLEEQRGFGILAR